MKRILILIILTGILFIIFSSNTLAWGPNFHNFILNRVTVEGSDTEISKLCLNGGINEQALRSGVEIPDITVVYYYSENGKAYRATHNFLFQQEVMNQAITEDEKCFAWGIMTHLIEDSISHTEVIPNKIVLTKVPNIFLHPLLEKKYDSELASSHPEVTNQTHHTLDAMYGSKGSRYIEMVQNALVGNSDINVKQEVDNLGYALDVFYDKAFVPKVQDNSLFAIYPYIDKITNAIHPAVGKINVQDINNYISKNVDLTISIYRNLGSRYSLSPHGFTELDEANKKAGWYVSGFFILLISLFTLGPIYLVWKKKKFKYAFLVLLIIPVVILAIAIIYIIL